MKLPTTGKKYLVSEQNYHAVKWCSGNFYQQKQGKQEHE